MMESSHNPHAFFKRITGLQSIYLVLVSGTGIGFAMLGMFSMIQQPNLQMLFLLVLFATLAEIAAPTLKIKNLTSITYEVGTAVSLAAVPFYGPAIGSLVIAISGLFYWLYRYFRQSADQWLWEQLWFNIGNRSISIFVAGTFLTTGLDNGRAEGVLFLLFIWLVTAVILDQTNLWLLIGLFRLLKGNKFSPLTFWQDNRWAMLVNIGVAFVGGLALATAIIQFGTVGLLVFILPIALSTAANQLYVRKMQAHLDNLEAIVADRTQELEYLMKEKDAFLAVLTHDMKTPLTSINLYAMLLLQKPHLAAEKPQLLETIVRSQKTLTNIVNDIVDIETLQSDKSLPMQVEPLDLTVLLSATVETLNAQATQKEIDLIYEGTEREIRIKGDRYQIERVLQNIISNAVKYTPEQGQIRVCAAVQNSTVIVKVSDNGYGIPPEDLPHIFDRYRRVKKHKDVASGSGLGLAVTKALVEAHSGRISVVSTEGEGTTFSVELPLSDRRA